MDDKWIKIKHTSGTARTPTKHLSGDAGWDLYSSKDVYLGPRDFHDIPTNIEIAMDPSIWGRIVGRSSTIRHWGCHVMEGIIDSGYRGELFIGVFNMKTCGVRIPAGTRVAQIIFHEHIPIIWNPVDELPVSVRGGDGFGSSGR